MHKRRLPWLAVAVPDLRQNKPLRDDSVPRRLLIGLSAADQWPVVRPALLVGAFWGRHF